MKTLIEYGAVRHGKGWTPCVWRDGKATVGSWVASERDALICAERLAAASAMLNEPAVIRERRR